MNQILLFGAGKSATVLIDYLLENAESEEWQLVLADASLEAARARIGNSVYGRAVALDIRNDAERSQLIAGADMVISLMPPSLHILIAKDCLAHGKNLLTASYVDPSLREMAKEIEASGL